MYISLNELFENIPDSACNFIILNINIGNNAFEKS